MEKLTKAMFLMIAIPGLLLPLLISFLSIPKFSQGNYKENLGSLIVKAVKNSIECRTKINQPEMARKEGVELKSSPKEESASELGTSVAVLFPSGVLSATTKVSRDNNV